MGKKTDVLAQKFQKCKKCAQFFEILAKCPPLGAMLG